MQLVGTRISVSFGHHDDPAELLEGIMKQLVVHASDVGPAKTRRVHKSVLGPVQANNGMINQTSYPVLMRTGHDSI